MENIITDNVTYFGELKSPNKVETREGYLICLNVPIARIGEYEYQPQELLRYKNIAPLVNPYGTTIVYRTESEVFDEKAIASFEGLPVTINHPPVTVNKENWNEFSKGISMNVRRGTGDYSDYLLADLKIFSEDAVRIVDGRLMDQISCGYTSSFIVEDGKIYQSKIRGNHVAIVQKGRAGDKAIIRDSDNSNNIELVTNIERGINLDENKEKGFLESIFGNLGIKTKDDAKLASKMMELITEDSAVSPEANPVNSAVEDRLKIMEDSISELAKSVTTISDMISKLEFQANDACKTVKDMDSEKGNEMKDKEVEKPEEKEIKDKKTDGAEMKDESAETPVDDSTQKVVSDAEPVTVSNIIGKLKPVVAKIKDDSDRSMVVDAMLDLVSDGDVKVSENSISQVAKYIRGTNDIMNDAAIENKFEKEANAYTQIFNNVNASLKGDK